VQWRCENRVWLQLDANLSAQPSVAFDRCEGRIVWIEGECDEPNTLPAWAVRWTVLDD
jgi:hypothetical protein